VALAFQTISAVAIPLLAVLWPVLKGTAITVREALSTYGLGGDFRDDRLNRLIERIGARFLPTMYAASLGNLFRRRGRLSLTLIALTTAGIMFLIVMSLIASTNFTLDNEMARQAYDIRIGFTSDLEIEEVLSLTREQADVDDAEMWYSRNATILRAGERLQDSAGLGAQLLGIPSDTEMYQPIIVSGRWLAPGDGQMIVISQETADKNDLIVGESISLRPR
jgi:putative ABC transport system permease protein